MPNVKKKKGVDPKKKVPDPLRPKLVKKVEPSVPKPQVIKPKIYIDCTKCKNFVKVVYNNSWQNAMDIVTESKCQVFPQLALQAIKISECTKFDQ